MSEKLKMEAMHMLEETSRTFFIPISLLAPGLKEAVTSAYLCMRAIDEIEDHPELHGSIKSELLNSISKLLEKDEVDYKELTALLQPYESELPEVTLRLGDWIDHSPQGIVAKIIAATSEMAAGMAKWAEKEWEITSEADLDQYTYYVAGLVGVMLADIWKWYDNTETDKQLAIAFGRGLQSVNILRNHTEDAVRGVSFFPPGWELDDMFKYAKRNLMLADEYIKDIKTDTILNFCKIPLVLAHGTLNALMNGKEKMSRAEVNNAVSSIVGKA